LEELSLDDLADALQAVEEEDPALARKLKEALDPETRAEVEELTQYEEDEAGGLMTPEYVAVRASMTVEDVLRFLRRAAPDAETIYYLYVVDEEGRLMGVLSLRDLIVADPRTKVAEIMNPKVVYVRTDTDQEEVARLMADYDFTVLPVVDEEGHLVGIVTVDDVLDVLEEEATEDIHKLAAVDVPDLVYSQASPLQLWLARVRWLIILILTGMVTSSILQGFESVLEAVTALAFYVPVLIGTGGNTGNQSATLIIRALATRDLDLRDWRRVLFKETVVGSLLGLTLASVLLIKVGLDGYGPLIPVVGLSLFLLVLFANLVGSTLPMVLRRLGVDPALVSNPLIATLSDVIGLLIYLSVARLILGI
jgi:Mg2+ transporter (mgtE)